MEYTIDFGKESRTGFETQWYGVFMCDRKEIGRFMIIYLPMTRRGEIYDIWIKPPFQGRGLGRFYLKRIEAFLKAKGAKILIAERPILDAIPFWEHMGYEMMEDGTGMFKPTWIRD